MLAKKVNLKKIRKILGENMNEKELQNEIDASIKNETIRDYL